MKQVEQIRAQYTVKETTALDELRALDKKVKTPARVFAYTFGGVGALVMGAGMSMAMNVIGGGMVIGIVVGVVGMAMAAVNYPLYQKLLQSRKNKYAKQIFQLSDSIVNKE
ncbi:MAG: dihydropteridine reductase [Clostridia bacterium]|nr:dihydropteridine reductase [Clostridia bacterium]